MMAAMILAIKASFTAIVFPRHSNKKNYHKNPQGL